MTIYRNWTARWGQALVVGAVILLGAAVATAQQRDPARQPADPELPTAAPEEPDARPTPKAKATQPASDPRERTAPRAKARADQPADDVDPRTPARRPADAPESRRPASDRPAADRPDGERDPNDRTARSEDVGPRRGEDRQELGIQFNAEAEGLTVGTIAEQSIAAQAGLREGDRIVTVDGQTIANQRQFQAYLSGQYGRRVPVIIERDGRQYTVQLGMQRPSADGAWLGVYLSEQEGEQAGARITHIYPSGPAARAGLRPGDTVLRINDRQIDGTPELIATVDSLEPNARAEFLVQRGQREVTIPVVLGNRANFVFYGGEEDYGRHGEEDYGRRFDDGRFEDDDYGRIPPHAMGLEHDRRMAEQHQRIEMELRKLQEEVRKLREALQARN